MAAVRELALRSPERLTGGHWEYFREKVDYAPVPRDLPDESHWFRPPLPAGTLLDVGRRLPVLRALQSLSLEDVGALRRLAPHNPDLAEAAVARMGGVRSVTELATVYGELSDYNLVVMGKLADAAYYDPVEFRKRQGAMCELTAEGCFFLGYRLAEMGFADEAAVAYQKAFDGAEDRVWAASKSLWLVDYYFDHGQAARAERVARAAAETYSNQGLYVLARLLERSGRLREAEEYYRRILDRYESASRLAGFYYRQARVKRKADYEARFRDALALAMPDGLEPLDRSTLPAKPEDGVVVKKENDLTKKFGLKYGNVIVGLDGFRVRDRRQYTALLEFDFSPKMKLVAWRGVSYDDIEAEVWDRDFRVTLEDVKSKASH
jgi:tetratricopeptide (TPR) repeat protein